MTHVDDDIPGKVTIYDVATRAGVSIATVSHTLNRPHKVSAATRDRVLQIIDELQFVPKATAISLARQGVGRIGVLAPFTSYPSYSTRLLGVLEECATDAVDIVVFDHASVADSPSPLLSALPATGRLDGLIIMGVPLDEQIAERLAHRKLATVLVDSHHERFSSVNINDDLGGYAVGRHLVDKGHRKIAFVSGTQRSEAYVSPGQLRLNGFRRAMAEAGLGEDAFQWVRTSRDDNGGDAVQEILDADDPATAVFAHHDGFAAGVLAELRARGCNVPGDISVVGYDGTDVARALDLTTVEQPFRQSGKLGAALLRSLLADRHAPVQHITLPAELRLGATS
jgi:DNA-binding LacI/PurR family transcriptional regulator